MRWRTLPAVPPPPHTHNAIDLATALVDVRNPYVLVVSSANDDISGWVPLHACRVRRWAGCGVAMGNAEAPAVQAAADRVTASNDDDGVAVILEKMLASSATPSVRCYSRATAAAAAAAASRL
jgi:hypothetical protein